MNIERTVSFQQDVFDFLFRLHDPGPDMSTLLKVHISVVVNLEDVIGSPIVIDVCLEDIILVGAEIFCDFVAVGTHSDYIVRGNGDFGIDKEHQRIEIQ